MKHIMHLKKIPFQKIYNGEKTIELRLYDEKRQQISVGDEIRFVYDENEHIFMKCKVTDIHRFSSFEELYKTLPLDKCGYTNEEIEFASYRDMDKYYSKELQEQYGVVGIEFEEMPWEKPFRDPFRMEVFMKDFENIISKYWDVHPDYRFGQILMIFQYALQSKGYKDFFYIEDDKFLEEMKAALQVNEE